MNLLGDVSGLLSGPDPATIVTAGDPVLRQICRPYAGELPTSTLRSLIELMRRTMFAAPGVGLAAPQVGLNTRIAVICDAAAVPAPVAVARQRRPLVFTVLINPEWEGSGPLDTFYEGCLSVPGYQAAVPRYRTVHVRYTDELGAAQEAEFSGWAARIIQHECDHLDGTLYLDKAELRSLSDNEQYVTRWSAPTPAASQDELGWGEN